MGGWEGSAHFEQLVGTTRLRRSGQGDLKLAGD